MTPGARMQTDLEDSAVREPNFLFKFYGRGEGRGKGRGAAFTLKAHGCVRDWRKGARRSRARR